MYMVAYLKGVAITVESIECLFTVKKTLFEMELLFESLNVLRLVGGKVTILFC